MQQTTDAFKRITSGEYSSRAKAVIAEAEYSEDDLWSVKIRRNVFGGNNPSIGNCISAEIDITFNEPVGDIPRMAEIRPYSQVYNDTESDTAWLPKGIFYIDTRDTNEGKKTVSVHGYDAMLKADKPYPASTMAWPAKDAAVLREIAADMDVVIDDRTWDIIPTAGDYSIPLPTQYTEREVLGFIAGMYGGSFVMNDFGQLQLIELNGLPEETDLLINEAGNFITFGGTRIMLRRRNNGG